jgi:tetratricopeptide (TPR) repeat protein
MHRLAGSFSLVLLTISLAAVPAAADDRSTCDRSSGELAIAACTRAIASGQFRGLELAKIHTNRGVELKRTGDLDGAIKDYDIAIKLNPNDPFAFNNRANAWRDKGDLDRAVADYGTAVRLDPEYAAAYTNRGLVHERRKDFARARADFKAALAAPAQKYANSRGAQQLARERLAALATISPE